MGRGDFSQKEKEKKTLLFFVESEEIFLSDKREKMTF